jgi:hypothetical protein
MSNVPRGWTTDEDRRLADTTRWPVLARLPDASADAIAERFAKPSGTGGVEYRFDPPQPADTGIRTQKSVQSSISQPHIFERGRTMRQRGIPRRESTVLPRSNPFSNPRPRLIDSVAPAVRFLTMAALFTAVGIWVQMLGRHESPPARSSEVPKTAAQPAAAPAKSVDNHAIPAPTATGPIGTQPESGARVGRVEGDDFASQRNSAAGPLPVARPTLTPPHVLISSGSQVPRVRVADSASNGESTDITESDESPAMARYPGFSMER